MTTTPTDAGAHSVHEPPTEPVTPEEPTEPQEAAESPADGDTFSRAYVEQLRTENADARVRAKRADDLQARLLDAVVRDGVAGVLEDADDLRRHVTDAELLDDDGYPDTSKVRAAAEQLAAAKPHLAARRVPSGDVDQGARAEAAEPVSLAGILRERAI